MIRDEYSEKEEEKPTTLRITIGNDPSESRDVVEITSSPVSISPPSL